MIVDYAQLYLRQELSPSRSRSCHVVAVSGSVCGDKAHPRRDCRLVRGSRVRVARVVRSVSQEEKF